MEYAFAVIFSSHSTDNWWTTSILFIVISFYLRNCCRTGTSGPFLRVIGRRWDLPSWMRTRVHNNIKASLELPPFAFVPFQCFLSEICLAIQVDKLYERSGVVEKKLFRAVESRNCLLRMLWIVRGCYTMWVHWHCTGTNKVRIDFLPYSQLRIDASTPSRTCSNCALIFNTFAIHLTIKVSCRLWASAIFPVASNHLHSAARMSRAFVWMYLRVTCCYHLARNRHFMRFSVATNIDLRNEMSKFESLQSNTH